MMPTTQINSIDCPSFSHLLPTQLVSILTRWGCHEKNKDNMGRYLNPIWLKNDGQNIVGIFPQKAFYLLPPANVNKPINHLSDAHQSTELQLLTLTRKYLPDFSLPSPSLASETENDDSSIEPYSKDTLAGEMQLSLSTIDSIDRFIGKLISYGETVDSVIKKETKDTVSAYTDGLMGFIGYDVMASNLVNNKLNNVDNMPSWKSEFTLNYLQQEQPTTYFGHYPMYLTCDIKHNQHYWQLHATTRETQAILAEIQAWLQSVIKGTRPIIVRPSSMSLKTEWSFDTYQEAFEKTQDYLHAGDCYQVNLTQVWKGNVPNNAKLVSYLPKLNTYTQAPFAGYLFTQNPKTQQDFELLSCSPELFFTFQSQQDGSVNIITKPIKGTRPRSDDSEQDNTLKNELANSEKDLAENVMIVDLLRNDLGKYAKTGTVKVPKRFEIESFSNVHHMVSTVTATLKDNIHPLEALFDSLPAGSITGTPKKRAIEIINELECEPRGAYCGTMGYMNFDGSGQWNVLIRALQANQQAVSLWAGGGITVASDCVAEHEECLDKVGNIIGILSNM